MINKEILGDAKNAWLILLLGSKDYSGHKPAVTGLSLNARFQIAVVPDYE